MNEKDRDRSGDGAGPAADDGPSCHKSHFRNLFLLILLLLGMPFANSQDTSFDPWEEGSGLSLIVNAGVLRADNSHANFYNGQEGNVNTIYRVMHSEGFGRQMWNDLTSQDLITSAISDYKQLTIAEYGNMFYKLAIQLGFGFKYEYAHGWAWLLRFDYADLNAVGSFLLNSGRQTGVLTNQEAYVACSIMGQERRVNIDLALSKKFPLRNGLDLTIDLGANVNNTKVEANDILVAGRTYNILDIWGGESPNGVHPGYEYINQGGLGYGAFLSLALGYTLPSLNSIAVFYTGSYNKINLQGYEAMGFQHLFGLRFGLANFSFWD